jgi:hypothetical protein
MPSLIQAELIGVPLFLHKSRNTNNPESQRITELELGIFKAHITLNSQQDVFTDPAIAEWQERLKLLLEYPGVPWKSSHRLEVLETEVNRSIELLENSIRSPVLKRLKDFLIAIRDGNIYGYYQQISKEEGGMIVEFSFDPDFEFENHKN